MLSCLLAVSRTLLLLLGKAAIRHADCSTELSHSEKKNEAAFCWTPAEENGRQQLVCFASTI